MIKKIQSINNFAVFNNFHWDGSVVGADGRPIVTATVAESINAPQPCRIK